MTKAGTEIVLVPKPIFSKKKQVTSVGLEAEIEPVVPGGGVPTGTVTFEIVKTVKKKRKTTTLGTAAVSGGAATLTLKAKSMLNMPIKLVYSGDTDFTSSTASPPALTQSGLKSLARPMIPLIIHGRPRSYRARRMDQCSIRARPTRSAGCVPLHTRSYHRWTSRKYMPKSSFRGATSGISTP